MIPEIRPEIDVLVLVGDSTVSNLPTGTIGVALDFGDGLEESLVIGNGVEGLVKKRSLTPITAFMVKQPIEYLIDGQTSEVDPGVIVTDIPVELIAGFLNRGEIEPVIPAR